MIDTQLSPFRKGGILFIRSQIMTAEEAIKAAARALHLDACGIASLGHQEILKKVLQQTRLVPFAPSDIESRLHADALLPGARAAIVCLFPYRPSKRTPGNLALYARARDYHQINHDYLRRLKDALSLRFPEASFFALVDTSPLVDRWLAWQAGLGWYGKSHCLIHPKYGSFFTIGTLLTTLPLTPDTPLSPQCGTCRRCIDACPGKALSENGFHPWTCKSYLTQKKEDLTEKEIAILRKTPLIFGCDVCQLCCPWNIHAAPSPLPEIQENRVESLSINDLRALSNRAFERAYKGYAFAWRGKKNLLRNLELLSQRQPDPHNQSD